MLVNINTRDIFIIIKKRTPELIKPRGWLMALEVKKTLTNPPAPERYKRYLLP